MKKLYFLVLFFVAGSVHAQNPDDIINIPDANLKLRLMQANYNVILASNLNGQPTKIDTNNDFQIQVSEAQNISSLILNEDAYGLFNATQFTDLTGLSYFTNLKRLVIRSSNLIEIDLSALINLEFLIISSPQIAPMQLNSLNLQGLHNLEELEIYQAPLLTTLDINGLESLQKIKYSFPYEQGTGGLSMLDLSQSPSLTTVEVSDTQITALDLSECPQLLTVNTERNLIETVNLSGSENIESISVENSSLVSLDINSLSNLKTLRLNKTLISELDVTNNPALINLHINDANLTVLDISNNPALMYLYCYGNNLTTFDISNNPALKYVECGANLLTSIISNNNYSLSTLSCSYNQLTTLNLMSAGNSNGLLSIFAHYNALESIYLKNGGYEGLYIGENPNLKYICADEYEVSSLQSLVSNLGYDCVVNSYCSFTPGGNFYTINGTATIDGDSNGCDTTEPKLSNLKFNITNGFQIDSLTSDTSGQYSIPVFAGTHTVTPVIENPSFFSISPATVSVTFPATTSPFTQNFCITPNGLHPDLEVTILPTTPARPGFDAEYKILIKNKGNIQQSGSVSFAYDDTVLDYEIATPVFTTQTEGLLSWAFADLQPFETREINVTLNVNSPMETPAVNGDDVLAYTATITSDQIDESPSDNTFTLPQIVVNSFDPNDKTCLEGTSITPDMIGQYVHYMIRFENTGTFAAQNIVVKDMIDVTKFDVSSLIALNGSHPYVTRITGNKVEFIFENINLPFDDANNDGYVVFKIKTLPTLALGDSFSNTASIYFDYNHPIITDPAVTTFAELGREDFAFNNYFTLYPNPTSGMLNITNRQAVEMQSISIYNVLGQMVVSVPNAREINNVDVSGLSAGNYFIRVISDRGSSHSKFIKK